MLLLISASLLVAGCADRRNAPGPTITATAVASVASPTIQATIMPSVTAPPAAPGLPGTPSGGLNLDPSLADISGGEDNDLTGFPETGLPTPTLD
jgi:hypothetical protein